MNPLVIWAIVGFIVIVIAGLIGRRVKYIDANGDEKDGLWLGILIDERQRFSLTHLQAVMWSLVFVSLLATIFLARLLARAPGIDPLEITIPTVILALAGISGGSAVLATTIKSPRTEGIRAQMLAQKNPSHFSQVFMVEEGENMDKVVDVTRFQNFFLTIIAVGAYVILAATMLGNTKVPEGFPAISDGLLWLIGISHASYIGGKIPEKK